MKKMLRKIKKKYFISDEESELLLEETRSMGFSEKILTTGELAKYNSSWDFINEIDLTVAAIEKEIEKAETLQLHAFVLENNASFGIDFYQSVLNLVGKDSIKKITSYTGSPLLIETIFGLFVIAPYLSRKTYKDIQRDYDFSKKQTIEVKQE